MNPAKTWMNLLNGLWRYGARNQIGNTHAQTTTTATATMPAVRSCRARCLLQVAIYSATPPDHCQAVLFVVVELVVVVSKTWCKFAHQLELNCSSSAELFYFIILYWPPKVAMTVVEVSDPIFIWKHHSFTSFGAFLHFFNFIFGSTLISDYVWYCLLYESAIIAMYVCI